MFKKTSVIWILVVLSLFLVGCTVLHAQSQDETQRIPSLASLEAPRRITVAPARARDESQQVPVLASSATPRTITVVGVGRTNLVPDIARLNVGTEVRASTVSEAKAKVDGHMEAIAAALKELGVEDKDIQTSSYSIYYEREPSLSPVSEGSAPQEQGAYRVSSMLEVTLRDIEKSGEVLDGAIAAGANQVYGVTFTVSDDQKWQSQARKAAMSDAKARAGELAELAGLKLGDVLSVSEVIGGSVPFMAERAMGGGGGGFSPGELEMSTQVQVVFAVQ
jgi:uncharacterized protein YggE